MGLSHSYSRQSSKKSSQASAFDNDDNDEIPSSTTARQNALSLYLDRLGPEAKSREMFVEKNLEHNWSYSENDKFTILSDSNNRPEDVFSNEYRPEKWTFDVNYRGKHQDFYANDVVRFQYSKIAKALGFFGAMPKTILRKNVINTETLDKVKGLESGSDNLCKVFLEDTPNGKSTARVLKDFGLRATRVNILVGNDFEVIVEPETTLAHEGGSIH